MFELILKFHIWLQKHTFYEISKEINIQEVEKASKSHHLILLLSRRNKLRY